MLKMSFREVRNENSDPAPQNSTQLARAPKQFGKVEIRVQPLKKNIENTCKNT